MTYTVLSLIVLAVAVAVATVALFSGHIPFVRTWTGAAPLLPEEPDTGSDFQQSVAKGFIQLPEWGPAPVYPRHPEIPKEGPK